MRPHRHSSAAAFQHRTLDCLQSSPAQLRFEQGEELAVVSRILGHASIATTADVYGHLTGAMLGRAAERTDAILGRAIAGA